MPTRRLIKRKGLRKKKTRKNQKTRRNQKRSNRNKKMKGGGAGRDMVLQALRELELKEDTNIDENYKKNLLNLMEEIDNLNPKKNDIRTRNKKRIIHICLLFLEYIGKDKPREEISTDEANKFIHFMSIIVSNFSTEEIPQDFENKDYDDFLNKIFNQDIIWNNLNDNDLNQWRLARVELYKSI